MRILLDECLPRRLKRDFPGHEVRTVPDAGWGGKDNGELLALADPEFDVFVTADQGIEYQQNLEGARIAVVVLAARSNRLADLRPLVPRILAAIADVGPGELLRVEA